MGSERKAPELLAFPTAEHGIAERQAARDEALGEAPPVFTEGRELPLAGLLLILPALAQVGLLEAAEQTFRRLPNGFYGLRALLLTLVFMALLREPRDEEATTSQVPADLGLILALDRALDVKTIRRCLGEMAARGLGEELVKALASRHAAIAPDALGFLYLDGHVHAYFGTRRLPKAYVARMRIFAPATAETRAAVGRGDPLFVVVAEPGSSMVSEIRRLLPELRALVGERRLTICFDRGGWSPELFYEITQAGFAFLTYRKGTFKGEPAGTFRKQTFVADGVVYVYELADRGVRLRLPNGKGRPQTLTGRQITRRSDDHQTPILTNRTDLSAAEVAHLMFGRWRQENYFRYAPANFALDAHDFYQAVMDDPERPVPNPKRAQLRRRLARARSTLAEREAALGAVTVANQESARRTIDCLKIANAALAKAVRLAHEQLAPDARLLEVETKLVTHAVGMSAYNAESILARLLAPHCARSEDEVRALLREIFRGAGDFEVVQDCLEVRLNPLSAPRRSRALAALCQQLNETGTSFPGTNLMVRYSVKQPVPVA